MDPISDREPGSERAVGEPSSRPPVPQAVARFGWIFAAVWLAYLIGPFAAIARDPAGWRQVLGFASLAGFVGLYLVGIQRGRLLRIDERAWPVWQRWLFLLLLACCVALMMPGAGDASLTGAAFVAAFAAASLPRWQAIGVAVTILAATEASVRTVPGWADHGYGFGVALAAIAATGFRLAWERNRALVDAQQELGRVAVEQERSRIARDLHDILGHSLTVIAVKAELAQRLLDVDVERARRELADLELLSRDALSDVRATALGVRGVSLVGEIAQARAALASAGIDAQLPTVADDVPTPYREVFAWTLREAVTNVIRHSRATRCVVTISPSELSVADDGVGLPAVGPLAGQGLAGLRRRVGSVGGSLETRTGCHGRGLEIVVQVPA